MNLGYPMTERVPPQVQEALVELSQRVQEIRLHGKVLLAAKSVLLSVEQLLQIQSSYDGSAT